MNRCRNCNSEKVIPKARVTGKNLANIEKGVGRLDFRLEVDEDPNAFIFKGTTSSKVYAKICGECGYTEFFANDAEELYNSYQKSVEKDKQNLVNV